MITSNEVSSMMAQQQQQQQMLSMGAPSPVVGASQYPPQFNYGLDTGLVRTGLAGGGGFPGAMASGVAGLGSALGSAASVTSMLSMFGIGGQTFGGTAGMLMGLNPLTAALAIPAMGLASVGGSMAMGNRVNSNVGSFLSAAGFANPASPSGFGFGLGDQTKMSQQIIGMGNANPFVNTQEQTQLLNKFQQMGLDKGITSIDKMMDKFKEFSKTTEDLAMSLGKTIGEVTGLVTQLKGQGFYSASEVTGAANRMAAGANYGIGMGQQVQNASMMATAARSQGMSGAAGAMLGTNLSQNFGAALQLGNVSETMAMDITGTTNTADASVALSQSIGGTLMSQLNRGGALSPFLSGLLKADKSGNLVIDDAAVRAASSGEMSIDQIKRRGQNTLSDANLKGQFANKQTQLASDLLKSNEGSTAVFGLLKNIAGEQADSTGMRQDDVFVNLMRNFGQQDERLSRLLYDLIDDLEESSNKRLTDEANYAAAQSRRSFLAKERSIEAIQRRVGHELGKFTNNAYMASGFAKRANSFKAAINRLERDIYGIEMASTALFTTDAVDETLSGIVSGEYKQNFTAAQGTSIFGDADMGYRARAAAASGLRYDKFGQYIQNQVDMDKVSGYGSVDQDLLNNFYYHTGDAARGGTFLTTRTGQTMGAVPGAGLGYLASKGVRAVAANSGMLLGKQVMPKALSFLGGGYGKLLSLGMTLGSAYLGSELMAGGSDETVLYKQLMADAKDKGATSEAEAHAMIASSPDGAAALQRYMKANGVGEDFSLGSMAKANYLAAARESSGMSYAEIGDAVGTAAGGIGGAAAGSGLFSVVTGAAGAYVGSKVGYGVGYLFDMMSGDNALREQSEAMHGAKLLSKLGSKEQLANFDKIYKDALRANGDSPTKAYAEAAEKLSKLLGENITGTDVQTALFDLETGTGLDVDERIGGNKYDKALNIAKAAKEVQMAEIAKSHLSEYSSKLTGEDDALITSIRDAAALGETGTLNDAMSKLQEEYLAGNYKYEGDNELITALTTGADERFDALKRFEGMSVDALDDVLGGKGKGAMARKRAGIAAGGGSLTRRELREIANQQSRLSSLSLVTPEARQNLATQGIPDEGADVERLATATKNLVKSTEELAAHVDNIGANLLNVEPYGRKISAYDRPETK